ncbi:MAG: hypothetical protein U0T81_18510 [Saprospiraceae bacterium]
MPTIIWAYTLCSKNDNTTAKSWFARTITLDPNDATASDALRILNKK